MSDTKALERALNLVLENDVLCASYGGVFREAAADLAELKAENEKSDVVLVFMQHELDTDRLTFRDAVEAIDKYRAELDEARKVIEMIDGLHPDFPVITDFLKAHPERK
jgi:hypothetical protein